MRITYSGGLRDDETGHHAFVFMKRKGGVLILQCELQVNMLLT